MPKTKGESIFFTAITAWMMVYVMTLYNIAIAMGSFTNAAFLIALKEMWIEYIIIALLAYFVSDHLINHIHQDQIVLSGAAFSMISTAVLPLFAVSITNPASSRIVLVIAIPSPVPWIPLTVEVSSLEKDSKICS